MPMKRSDPKFQRAYARGMLRSEFLSLFWAIISDRKAKGGFTFQALAKAAGVDKGKLSHWLKGDPNWTVNTIAGLANALDVELRIVAVERSSGRMFDASGLQDPAESRQDKPMQVEGMTETMRPQEPARVQVPQGIGWAPDTSAEAA